MAENLKEWVELVVIRVGAITKEDEAAVNGEAAGYCTSSDTIWAKCM